MMEIATLEVPDVKLLGLRRHADKRGFFSETYNSAALREAGVMTNFVQDNYSFSLARGTVRGLHFQLPPAAQAKLVMVFAGRILDVVVDCRRGSPTYGRHVAVELSRDSWSQLYVPEGFAHGFCTLEPDTSVLYKVSAPYAPKLDSGVLWNDPDLGIKWPVEADAAVITEKDLALPRFRDLADPFVYRN
ncbi:dTDP-4-dehydrorhamnose 3,5-epimerase [Bradyrhizobium sp. AZCC 1577]